MAFVRSLSAGKIGRFAGSISGWKEGLAALCRTKKSGKPSQMYLAHFFKLGPGFYLIFFTFSNPSAKQRAL